MTDIQPSSLPIFKLGLTGYPLGHSLSPKIHDAALRACDLYGSYSLFSIHPNDQPGLETLMARIRSGELHGLNVTIPHKQNVIPFLDELTATAQTIGAVNTIYLRENRLIGDNTDVPGFLADLNRFLYNHQSETLPPQAPLPRACSAGEQIGGAGVVNRKSAIVLGAGGSARAVVYALANAEWTVTVAARRIEQAQQLVASLPHYKLRIMSLSELQLSTFNLIVNTTPVGMTPETDRSPLPENMIVPKDVLIYDLVYNPRETKLVSDARAKGLFATTGLGMLIEQAALAFELWTGCKPPRDSLWDAVEINHKSLIDGD